MAASNSTGSPVSGSVHEQSGAEQIASLMEQVKSKDALVLQLTERLEAAAEQLDRIQRTGADRRHPAGGGGSRELAEQAGQLTSRVEEALDAWGQSSGHYEIILQRLDEIADHLQGSGAVAPSGRGGAGGGNSSSSRPAPSAASSSGNSAGAAGAPGQGSFWEKMKASMIDGGPAPSQPTPAPAVAVTSGPDEMPIEEVQERPLAHLAPIPTVIDVDQASIEDLREAVAARDAYISMLIGELRTAQPLPPMPADLQNCDWAPEELVASLQQLEQRLKTEIQREGLELSLERARMARERVRLDQVKAQLEGQIKRLSASAISGAGEASGAAATPQPAEAEPSIATGKLSWLKRLQPKNKS